MRLVMGLLSVNRHFSCIRHVMEFLGVNRPVAV